MGYREVFLWVSVAEGEIASTQAERAGDDSYMHAMSAFDQALAGFERMHMPREICDVALLKADLLERLGRKDEALGMLRDVALPLAERHLFAQVQPLSRIETRIGVLSPETIHEIRNRRMLGGISKERYNARLRGERHRLTVWTCDIRGFTRYCTETPDPLLVVDMLNRFFAALGAPILDHGGRIDKYVGDNILAYFRDPSTAAHMALWALWAMEQLNTEREHLAERRLEIGLGLSTGEVVEGNVGFAGKLEHTIIGTPVNTACRLVGEADPGQILIDGATRSALGDEFICARPGRETISLKGLGEVQVFELKATKDAVPMSRRGGKRWAVR
jgi:class 3 adenylate cyclase